MRITIIGDGGWGTALAVLLSRKKYKVSLWGAFPKYLLQLKLKRKNIKFLPGVSIPEAVDINNDLSCAVQGAKLIILAVPSLYMRNVLKKIKKLQISSACFLSVAKGIECSTAKCMSDVIIDELGNVPLAALSGPNIAYEVARGIPSAAVCAAHERKIASFIQDVLMMPNFRVYTSNDLIGVELAGAFKNIIAIACGISDGLGFGTNTKSALLTRGLAEITRLGIAMGAKQKTFSGLSGMGDLVTTCMSTKSRNRWLGEELGKGKSLERILQRTEMVIEGVTTTKTALKLSRKYGVNLPITQEVYQVLFNHKAPRAALESLMTREKKQEF